MHLNVFVIHTVGITILKVLDMSDILLDIAVTDRIQFGVFLLAQFRDAIKRSVINRRIFSTL